MTEVYHLVGGFKVHDLHKHNVPHTKFMGDSAPVISVYDSTIGNTVPHYHKGGQNKGKLKVMSEEKDKTFQKHFIKHINKSMSNIFQKLELRF